MRRPFFVPETKNVRELLREMKKNRVHLAVAVDEFGGVAGIVTMEDLVEEVMGEIEDEYDFDEAPVKSIDDRTTVVDAAMRLDEVNELLNTNLQCEEAESVGGLVMAELGHIPREGERVTNRGVTLTVEKMDGLRVDRVRLVREGNRP